MDLSKYTFYARSCAARLDEIESRLGVKFDRKALFDHEQSLIDQSQRGPRMYDVRWTFKFSKDGAGVRFLTSRGDGGEEVKECDCGNHVEFTSTGYGYGTNALDCALNALDRNVGEIQTIRKKLQGEQMTLQDKETIMHETIARASLVAFAEFIGQPIDADATIQQARGLYNPNGAGSMALHASIPLDTTKPINVSALARSGESDGVKIGRFDVVVYYWLSCAKPQSLAGCSRGLTIFAAKAATHLATERAKLTSLAPPTPKPTPASQAIVSALNEVSATLASLAERIRNENSQG